MKEILYQDFVFKYRIYAEHLDPNAQYTGPDVLLVSHDLSHSGAPHMVLMAAKAIKASGGFPVVVSPDDGPLREVLIDHGITVIIDASVDKNHFLFERFAANFDAVIVNTSVLYDTIIQLSRHKALPLAWWLHESNGLIKNMHPVAVTTFEQVRPIVVSNYAARFLPKRNTPYEVLYCGLPAKDETLGQPTVTSETSPLKFLCLGTYEHRNAQDVLLCAIIALPKHIREQCHFTLAGRKTAVNQPFWQEIERQAEQLPEVEMRDEMTPNEALALISASDVIVCCSRDESFSLTVAEAAQFGKPSILSETVGAGELFSPDSAYYFNSGDAGSLRDTITKVFNERVQLAEKGENAKLVYEQHMTETVFRKNFNDVLNRLIEPDNRPV